MVESTKLEANIMLMATMKPQRQCTSSMVAIGMDALAVSSPKRNIQKMFVLVFDLLIPELRPKIIPKIMPKNNSRK
jgi:hypothetical protein